LTASLVSQLRYYGIVTGEPRNGAEDDGGVEGFLFATQSFCIQCDSVHLVIYPVEEEFPIVFPSEKGSSEALINGREHGVERMARHERSSRRRRAPRRQEFHG
jgi:hypothetical protein